MHPWCDKGGCQQTDGTILVQGRRTISRDEYNEQENPFPILHLKLADTTHMLAVWENKKQFLDAAVAG